jgi:hypothetical protein
MTQPTPPKPQPKPTPRPNPGPTNAGPDQPEGPINAGPGQSDGPALGAIPKHDANHPTGGSNINPGIQIDTSRAAVGNQPRVNWRQAQMDASADHLRQRMAEQQRRQQKAVADAERRMGEEIHKVGHDIGKAMQLGLLTKWAKELGLYG